MHITTLKDLSTLKKSLEKQLETEERDREMAELSNDSYFLSPEEKESREFIWKTRNDIAAVTRVCELLK